MRRILVVTGGKGGIGKSLVSSTLALVLSGRGLRTGLLDLDLTGPCAHIFLGFDTCFPSEEFGIEPPIHHGIRCLSIAHFAGDRPAPLRGDDMTNALLELLAITRWGALDALVIDLPPGLGDVSLDTLRLLQRAEFLVVATGSRVVLETVRRTLRLLTELRANTIGVLENMRTQKSFAVAELADSFEVPFLGFLPLDKTLEAAIGNPRRLAATPVALALQRCTETLFDHRG